MGNKITKLQREELILFIYFNREEFAASAGVDPKLNAGCFIDTGVANDDSSFTMVRRLFIM